jgi:hypothetical protein
MRFFFGFLSLALGHSARKCSRKAKQWETYGNLNFTLANGEILLVVDVHSFKRILRVIAALH